MTGKRRSRYDVDEPETPAITPTPVPIGMAIPGDAPAESVDVRILLEGARIDVERMVDTQMRGLESALAAHAESLVSKLRDTRAEIDRLGKETELMRQNKYDELLTRLRSQFNAL